MLKEIENEVFDESGLYSSLTVSEQLKVYVNTALDYEEKINDLEAALVKVKQEYRQLMYSDLPTFFVSNGVVEFKIDGGKVFKLKTYVNAKPAADYGVFKEWLESSGNGEFIKNEISINIKGYNTTFLEGVLAKEGLVYGIEKKVHPQTLNSIVRRSIENGEVIPESAVTVETGSFVKLT